MYYLARYVGFSYEALRMYNIEKRSAVLENAAGFARQDVYMCGPVTKWQHWGMFIHWGKFACLRTLYESECHQR